MNPWESGEGGVLKRWEREGKGNDPSSEGLSNLMIGGNATWMCV